MADWTPWLDDAIHEINQRWGLPLDDSDQPDMEPLPESMVRETAMAVLTPAITEIERLRRRTPRSCVRRRAMTLLAELDRRAHALTIFRVDAEDALLTLACFLKNGEDLMVDEKYKTKIVEVTKNPDGTVTTQIWPSPSVQAVAERLRSWYVSEHETDEPVSAWWPQAIELVGVYLEAEGQA